MSATIMFTYAGIEQAGNEWAREEGTMNQNVME